MGGGLNMAAPPDGGAAGRGAPFCASPLPTPRITTPSPPPKGGGRPGPAPGGGAPGGRRGAPLIAAEKLNTPPLSRLPA